MFLVVKWWFYNKDYKEYNQLGVHVYIKLHKLHELSTGTSLGHEIDEVDNW